jgi:transcriptional accessory protein Tex/SPT6
MLFVACSEVQNKVVSVIKKVEKNEKLDDALRTSLLACQTLDDVEHLVSM